jgi:PAS domain S-box-containing protein/diguanylate cyclase (GGDEF)-like protein
MSANDATELLNHLPALVYKCRNDEQWTMLYLSSNCVALTGYTKQELLGKNGLHFNQIIHVDDFPSLTKAVADALANNLPFNQEYRIRTKSGEIKWVWEQGAGIRDENNNITYIQGFITEVTPQKWELKKLEQHLKLKDRELLINHSLLNEYKKAADVSSIVSKTDDKGRITYVNELFCEVSGYSKEELVGQSHNIIRHPDTPKSVFIDIWRTILDKRVWKGVIKNQTKNKKTYYVQSFIVPIIDHEGNIREFMAIRNDVTDLILQEQRIRIQVTDHMTQLPNRQKLLEDFKSVQQCKFAVVNICRFKEINEYYGFDVGDRLLVELANVISAFLHTKSIKLYKLTGDEFGLLADMAIAKELFKNIVTELLHHVHQHTFAINQHSLSLNLLCGIAMQKNFLINAEIALNHAKIYKKDLIVFDDNLQIKDHLKRNIHWTNKLNEAVQEDRIDIYLQPIFDNNTRLLNKYECLMRFIDTDGTVVSPYAFLDIAKKTRLYPTLTRIVIKKAFNFFHQRTESFSINLSLEDILEEDTVNFIIAQINEKPSIAHRLVFEIVEDEGIENYDEVSAFIEKMKSFGCAIAIDDFGTGYSNFDYLIRLNADYIKIDGSIIKNINHDVNSKIVTELIVSFAKRLKLKTIAEYVHSQDVEDTVRKLGISYSQGFHLGKPVSMQSILKNES